MKAGAAFILIICLEGSVPAQTSDHGVKVSVNDTTLVREWLAQSAATVKSNPPSSKMLAEKSLQLSEKLNFLEGIALSNLALGNNLFGEKRYSAAIEYYQKAKAIFQQREDEFQNGRVLKMIAETYKASGFIRNAFDNYREAALFLRKTGQMQLLNECQDAMGDIVAGFGEPANAINFYKRSLVVKNNLHDKEGVINTNSKIAALYLSLKQYDSALIFNKEVQRLARNEAGIMESAVIEEMNIYSLLGKIDEAEKAKENVEQLIGQSGNIPNKIKLLVASSGFYMAQHNKELSAKYFDSAARMIENIRSPELAAEGLSLLADMSSQQGDYITAYRMAKMLVHYKEKFRTENIEHISAELRNDAEANLKEKEIEYLNLLNKLKQEALSKEELKRMTLLRENMLKDSSLANQRLLMAALETEADLRNNQLAKEKELSNSLSRENELKQKMLNDARRNKTMLWAGIGALSLLGVVIFFQYRWQKRKNVIINKQSSELEVLNKEIHHRVKNNLQVISSMLDLQSQSLNDDKATAIIKEGIQRVQSMAFIHQNLYQGNAVNSVNMNEYIKMLSNHLFQTYNIRTDKIHLHTQIENLNLHTDTAIPLGMILNELISNSLKYAFKGKENGDIWVTMKKTDNELLLQVKDNGIGLPTGFNPDNTFSFGYEIIKAFSQKMKARMNIDGSNGADVQIIISKFKTTD